MRHKLTGVIRLFWTGALLVSGVEGEQALAADLTNRGVAELRYEEPVYLAASIYGEGADRNKLLFNFKRVATRSGSTLKVERDFTYPDGRPAARERAVYEEDI